MRRILMVANWKMNKSISEARAFCQEFVPLVNNSNDVEIVICSPFTSLHVLKSELNGSMIKMGAQNLFWEEKGAYTGEISSNMLIDAGCDYVIIGHSERRQIMGENNVVVNRKIRAALTAGLIPILCVGETLKERENLMAKEAVKEQLIKCLEDISLEDKELVVAYEPVWAIGTGVNASSDDAQEMIGFIRNNLSQIFNKSTAGSVRILYGGSVKEDNTAELMAKEDVDGALVGGASLHADSFAGIVRLGQHG